MTLTLLEPLYGPILFVGYTRSTCFDYLLCCSEIDKTIGLLDALFGRPSTKVLSSDEIMRLIADFFKMLCDG